MAEQSFDPFKALKGKPGRIFKKNMTPEERAEMKKLGVECHDVMPAEVADIIADTIKQYQDSHADIEALKSTPQTTLKVVSIDDLPDNVKAAIKQRIDLAVESMKRIDALRTGVPEQAASGIAESMAAANRAEIDEIAERFAAAYNQTPIDTSGISNQHVLEKALNDIADRPSSPKEEIPAEKTKETEVEKEVSAADAPAETAGGSNLMTFCPQCKWKLDIPCTIEPTEKDIEDFAESWMLQVPWEKSFELIADRGISITFREMIRVEVDAIREQMMEDIKRGKIFLDDFAGQEVVTNSYGAAMSISAIKLGPNAGMDIDNYETWMSKQTDLENSVYRYARYVFGDKIKSESFQYAVIRAFQHFRRLVEKLTWTVQKQNFLSAAVA